MKSWFSLIVAMAICAGAQARESALDTPANPDESTCSSELMTETQVREGVQSVIRHSGGKVLGMNDVIERGVIAMILGGHVLFEGVPGVSKSRLVKSLAKGFSGTFGRIQYVPDLLPSDIIGSEVYDPESHRREFKPGPIFHNFVLADEINRGATKTQSATLEAMEEKQVTVAGVTRKMPEIFTMFATQNPLDQAGTFPLPEAQLDRFLMRVMVKLPNLQTERDIMRLVIAEEARGLGGQAADSFTPASLDYLVAARRFVLAVPIPEAVETYILTLVDATRNPGNYVPQMASYVSSGVGPRGTLAIAKTARALAWLRGKPEVTFQEVEDLILDTLSHRVILNRPVVATQNMTVETVLKKLNDVVRQNLGIQR